MPLGAIEELEKEMRADDEKKRLALEERRKEEGRQVETHLELRQIDRLERMKAEVKRIEDLHAKGEISNYPKALASKPPERKPSFIDRMVSVKREIEEPVREAFEEEDFEEEPIEEQPIQAVLGYAKNGLPVSVRRVPEPVEEAFEEEEILQLAQVVCPNKACTVQAFTIHKIGASYYLYCIAGHGLFKADF